MDIVETRESDAVTLALKGRLDNASSPGFEERVLKHINAGDRRLVIDLAQLDYISSVGLRVFMLAAKRLKPAGGRIVYKGQDITGWSSHSVSRAGLVQVPEGRRIIGPLTV